MGTALTTAWSLYTGDATHILESTRQILSIHDYLVLFNDTDSLYHHGFNAHDGHLSCCKWGRGITFLKKEDSHLIECYVHFIQEMVGHS